jgi:hypothetical protein
LVFLACTTDHLGFPRFLPCFRAKQKSPESLLLKNFSHSITIVVDFVHLLGYSFSACPLSARGEFKFMRSNTLKVSAVVLGAIVALSAVKASAIPAGPLPIPDGGKLRAIPAGPLPIPDGGKLSSIPAGPLPIPDGGKLAAIPAGPLPIPDGGRARA